MNLGHFHSPGLRPADIEARRLARPPPRFLRDVLPSLCSFGWCASASLLLFAVLLWVLLCPVRCSMDCFVLDASWLRPVLRHANAAGCPADAA